MSGSRFNLPYVTPVDGAGSPMPGALLYFFITGSSTLAVTYANAALTVANPNPVQANGFGRFPNIFLDPAVTYKVTLTPAFGSVQSPIWTADPVSGAGGGGGGSSNLVYVSNFGGSISEAAAAAGRGLVFVDENTQIAAPLITNATIVPAGGLISSSGSLPVTVANVSGFDLPVFDSSTLASVDITNPSGPIKFIYFDPPTDGITDFIQPWNLWSGSCVLEGCAFEGLPGDYHTSSTNKLIQPSVRYTRANYRGMSIDSTVVVAGPYQWLDQPVVAGQTLATVNLTAGPGFTAGEVLQVGTDSGIARVPSDGKGRVLSWNAGTSVLTCYARAPLFKGTLATVTIRGLSSGSIATVLSVAYKIAAGFETNWSVFGFDLNRQVFNTQWHYLNGETGANTDGTTVPTKALPSTKVVGQESFMANWVGMGGAGDFGRRFFCDASPSVRSFFNANVLFNMAELFNQGGACLVGTNASYNRFFNPDDESNNNLAGSTIAPDLWNVTADDNSIYGGLMDPAAGINSINFRNNLLPAEDGRLYVNATRMTSPPIGQKLTMLGRQAYVGAQSNDLPLVDLLSITTPRRGINDTATFSAPSAISGIPTDRKLVILPSDNRTNIISVADTIQFQTLSNCWDMTIRIFCANLTTGGLAGIPAFDYQMIQTTAGVVSGDYTSGSAPSMQNGTLTEIVPGMSILGLSAGGYAANDTITIGGNTGTIRQVWPNNVVVCTGLTNVANGATYATSTPTSGTVTFVTQEVVQVSIGAPSAPVVGNIFNDTTINISGTLSAIIGSASNFFCLTGVKPGSLAVNNQNNIAPGGTITDTAASKTANIIGLANNLIYVDDTTGMAVHDSYTSTPSPSAAGAIGAIGSPLYGGDAYQTLNGAVVTATGSIIAHASLASSLAVVFTTAALATSINGIFQVVDFRNSPIA